MKVALIGNMNNNYFSLMRYLRDMGVEADLLMFADEAAHFQPEKDTWEIEKWQPFIKQTKLIGGGLGQYFSMSKEQLRKEFGDYDYYIGCGFTPAYFHKAGMQLDLFTPYCVGIEYTYRITKTKPVHYIKEKIEAFYQKKGLRNNTKVVGTIDEESRIKAHGMGINVFALPMLMIYNKEVPKCNDAFLNATIEKFKSHYPVVFSHVSHFPTGSRTYEIKRNDILINAFVQYTEKSTGNPLLVLFEYGEGVNESKQLIKELGIEHAVMWLPLLSRKQIMLLLEHVHFGGGEFGGAVWGGTGWEFMSKGVPFFQYVAMSEMEFEKKTGLMMPPFFNTADSSAIAEILALYAVNEALRKENGNSLKLWFDNTAGEKLAKQYVDIIVNG